MMNLLAIAGGGAVGALMRHGVNGAALNLFGAGFPYGTLAVNVAGSFIMGVLISVFAHLWQPPAELRLFLVTGLLGAFTTFSTFSLDFAVLWERGEMLSALIYMTVSVALAVAALFAGMMLIRGVAL